MWIIVHLGAGLHCYRIPYVVESHHVSFLNGRGYVIIATPYASGFDHLRIADEAQFKFDRCLRALMDDSRYRSLVQYLILLCSIIDSIYLLS